MRLLIVTQKVDQNDPVLGFFHRWIIEFAKHCESVVVICLEKGDHKLPANVRVLSLKKEEGKSRRSYVFNFYKHILKERGNYDVVFVHMNQEYLLLAGWIWKLLDKRMYMWRNHHAGSFLTDIAASFCKKIFCTSKYSFTAKYKKTVFMPVGVDIEHFKLDLSIQRTPRSILSLGRISPSKNIHTLIASFVLIKDQDENSTVDIYGNPLPSDVGYYGILKDEVNNAQIEERVSFYHGVPHTETAKIYSAHDIFVNLSSSGMYDKTIFEAMACGCIIIASNDNLRGLINDDFVFKQGDAKELSLKLMKILKYTTNERMQASAQLQAFSKEHGLEILVLKIMSCITK